MNRPRSSAILVLLGLLATVGPRAGIAAPDGEALIGAAKRGDLATVEALLHAGVNPDAHDPANNTALIFAARDGRIEIVRALVEGGATVNWIDGEGVTPLILASFKGHLEVVTFLLDHGADPMIRDQWHRTALDYALRGGEADEIAKLLRSSSFEGLRSRSVLGDVPGWQNVRWGMSEVQVRMAVGNRFTEVVEKYADGYSPLKVRVRIRSYLLHAFPIFSNRTGELMRVLIRSQAPEYGLWDTLYNWVEQHYGTPTERDTATSDTEEYTWRGRMATIRLLHVNLRVPRISRIVLIYQRGDEDED